MDLTVLVPCHQAGYVDGVSEPQIVETIRSLQGQTVAPKRIIVLINNCKDDAAERSLAAGAEVAMVPPNPDKKAGALNFWLDQNLAQLADDELVMVMDADSALDRAFVENAMNYITRGYHAVGGVFTGKDGGGLVGTFQRNEYARYARDVARKDGRTLVLTGTATIFTARCLKDVVNGRTHGKIPGTGEVSHVYDTKALTEDNELTYALLHLGYAIIAPPECKLKTEVMTTWKSLRKQRYRWKRGAVENNHHYGFTRKTAKYWFLQWWGTIGILATALYLMTLVAAFATGSIRIHAIWIAVTAVYSLERIVTVRARGWKQMLVGGLLIIEMPYDMMLQYVQAKALIASALHTKKDW